MPQARLTGRSIPKVVRVNADDNLACVYKNLGNGRRVPFIWGATVTLASGTTEVVVASGINFSGFTPETGLVQVTPVFTVTSGVTYNTDLLGKVYIEKDVDNALLTLKSTVSGIDYDTAWDVLIFLGDDTEFTNESSNQIWKRRDQNSM